MGRSLIIQGIVSEFHFHVNNSNYSIKHMALGKWGGGGNRPGVWMSITGTFPFTCLVGQTLQVKRTLRVTFSKKGN